MRTMEILGDSVLDQDQPTEKDGSFPHLGNCDYIKECLREGWLNGYKCWFWPLPSVEGGEPHSEEHLLLLLKHEVPQTC